ncbi:MAG: Fic family protein [Anaerolineales bacterium]|nr:Fic family protein [Anaerolineales bacterium]
MTLNEVLLIHERLLMQSGGSVGLRDMGVLESAIAQPRMTFAGHDLYPTPIAKAAALGFSIIQNHLTCPPRGARRGRGSR